MKLTQDIQALRTELGITLEMSKFCTEYKTNTGNPGFKSDGQGMELHALLPYFEPRPSQKISMRIIRFLAVQEVCDRIICNSE